MITRIENEEISQQLHQFDQRGGVLEYFIFKCDLDSGEVEKHRAIALETISAAVSKRNAFFVKTYHEHCDGIRKSLEIQKKRLEADGIDCTGFVESRISPPVWKVDTSVLEREIPERISLETFLGYDTITKTRDGYFFGSQNKLENGYLWAFFLPPHHLSGFAADFHKESTGTVSKYFDEAGAQNQAMYTSISRTLFGDMDNLVIYRWGTDCSGYFDDGKEFWGAFFWTVYSPQYDWYVGILGSTTD